MVKAVLCTTAEPRERERGKVMELRCPPFVRHPTYVHFLQVRVVDVSKIVLSPMGTMRDEDFQKVLDEYRRLMRARLL